VTDQAGFVDFLRRDNFGTRKLFSSGKAFVSVGTNFASLLRCIIFISKTPLCAKLLKIQPFAILPRSFDFLISFQAESLFRACNNSPRLIPSNLEGLKSVDCFSVSRARVLVAKLFFWTPSDLISDD
jgi:hypothetical protein